MTKAENFKKMLDMYLTDIAVCGVTAKEKLQGKRDGMYHTFSIRDTEVFRILTLKKEIGSAIISIAPNTFMEAKEYEISEKDAQASDSDKQQIKRICKHIALAVAAAMQDNYHM